MQYKNLIKLLLAITALTVLALACEFSASTAEITDAYMTSDVNGTIRADVYGSDDIFYCVVEMENAPDDTVVKVDWYAVDVELEGIAPETLLGDYEITTGDGPIVFNYDNDMRSPDGEYRVDIYLNGEFNRSVEFTVEGPKAEITNAYLSLDDQGATPTTTYSNDATIYLIVETANATPETTIRAEWIAVDVAMAGLESGTVVDEYEFQSGESPVLFYYDNDMLSPNGTYRVDLYLDDEFDRRLTYTVEGGEMAITDVFMAMDENGSNPTTTYTSEDSFYLIVDTVNGIPDTTYRAEWFAVDINLTTIAPDTKVDQYEFQSDAPRIYFELDNGNIVFPEGEYRVDFYLNGTLNQSIPFNVEGGNPGVSSAYMSLDSDGTTFLGTDAYSSDSIFYLRIILQNALDTTTTKVYWYAENIPDTAPHTKVYEFEAVGAGPYITFDLSNTDPWPAGEYSVEVFVDGELITNLLFKVE